MVPEGMDVVSVKLDTLRAAALACSVIPRDNSASPCPMLASSVLPATVRIEQRMRLALQPFLAESGAFPPRAEFSFGEERDRLGLPLAEFRPAVLTVTNSRLVMPKPWMVCAQPIL
jgi:hypothetical protein